MGDKALNSAELELTQKIQIHFPRGISSEVLARWNGCPKEIITARLEEIFGKEPETTQPRSLVDFFRETGELTIEIPALPRPTFEELQAKFPRIKKIERDTSPTGPVTMKFGTVLRPGEKRINGAEYERRLTPKIDIVLGYQHWNWVFEHQSEYPDLMALLGKIYIDFPGIIVVLGDGGRSCPCLFQGGGRFGQGWDWFDNVLGRSGRIAVSGK